MKKNEYSTPFPSYSEIEKRETVRIFKYETVAFLSVGLLFLIIKLFVG